MDSLRFDFFGLRIGEGRMSFHQRDRRHSFSTLAFPSSPRITCGLRRGPRKPLWRSSVLSTEAIQAIQSLKLAKSVSKLEDVFHGRIERLLKADLVATLAELQRQDEWEIALKVFAYMRKEVWYKPEISLYCDMIFMLGKHKLIGMVEELVSEMEKEGLKPNARAYTELIGAYLEVDMIQKGMETYRQMKDSGCEPEKLTFTILIRNLEKAGEEELASAVKKECAEYMDYPRKFLNEVKKTYRKTKIELV